MPLKCSPLISISICASSYPTRSNSTFDYLCSRRHRQSPGSTFGLQQLKLLTPSLKVSGSFLLGRHAALAARIFAEAAVLFRTVLLDQLCCLRSLKRACLLTGDGVDGEPHEPGVAVARLKGRRGLPGRLRILPGRARVIRRVHRGILLPGRARAHRHGLKGIQDALQQAVLSTVITQPSRASVTLALPLEYECAADHGTPLGP